jgi:hypothetical protein
MSSNYNLVKLWYFLHRHFLLMIKVLSFRLFTNSYIITVTTQLRITVDLPACGPAVEAIVRCHIQQGTFFSGPFDSYRIKGQFECPDFLGNALVSSSE